jgi:hypothetical protein
MLRKLIVVLLTGKPLLFGCCYKPAVEQQGRSGIVKVAGDT